MAQIFPSLISADLMRLGEEIKLLEPYVDGFHIDVMDFHFVPNLTWGFSFIEAIRKATDKQLQIHLMVDYPEKYLPKMVLKNGDIVSIHVESKSERRIEELLKDIASHGWIPSIALSPRTSISALGDIALLQHVLLMTVYPGFSGQKLIPETFFKLAKLDQLRKEGDLSFIIAVDGGITQDNCSKIVKYGGNQLAIASAIFNNADRIEAIKVLRKEISQ